MVPTRARPPGDRMRARTPCMPASWPGVNPDSDFNLNWSESAEIVQQFSAEKPAEPHGAVRRRSCEPFAR
ncbi:hypothetical protein DN582_20765 [Burkholderia multivorans]|nr:hypothetical protein DN497_17120 [Burkholderia multivorans]RAD99808.1 hypothetical protein DN582_20765 [Burkholderia multivorans]RAG38062.1 hypothetical protein DN574_02515 [Burkholderia multivorans]RAG73551.1 hypothetical protein DN550_02095 [Burkholderia multivorans]